MIARLGGDTTERNLAGVTDDEAPPYSMDRGFNRWNRYHGNVPGQLPEMGLGLAGGWNKLSQTDKSTMTDLSCQGHQRKFSPR